MGVASHELRAYQAAHEQGRLPVRVDAVLGIPARFLPTEEVERRLDQYFGPGPGFGNGRTLAGVLKDGEQVSRMEALRMWTINNAAALDQDRDRGSLRAGKLADLVVLSGNFEECSDDELADLVVDMTVIAGNVVFARLKPDQTPRHHAVVDARFTTLPASTRRPQP
jgi:hypothetical protein